MRSSTISVIGAGPAGLSAAWFLIQKDFRPVVYEGSKHVGGLAGSINLWGRVLDIGPHIFLESSQPAAVEFWKKIGGTDLQRLTLSRGMILKSRLIAYPPKPSGLLYALGIRQMSLAAAGIIGARFFSRLAPKNSGDFFRKFYGDYFRRLVFNPFCEKYMGIPDTQVDVSFATGLTSFVKEAGKTDVQPEKEKLKTLLYHKKGTQAMWSLLGEEIIKKGEICFEKKVTKITTNGNRVEALYFSDGSVVHPDFAISSLPLTVLLNILDHCPAGILEEAKKLKSYNTVLVYFHLSSASFPFQYITIFDHSAEAGRVTNFNTWQRNSDEMEGTIVCVEYWCNDNAENWNATEEALIAKARKELLALKISGSDTIKDAKVLRLRNSHPVLSNGYTKTLEKINAYLAQFENLFVLGRHATFKWDGQADNIISGIDIADKIECLLKSEQ